MLFRSLASLALAASALALNIQGPSADAYWVQNVSNVINWSYSSSDPNPIDIIITNGDNNTLNGAFSIERNVDLTNGTFTVSNVTLKVGTGYKVSFVNGTNQTQIYGSSNEFEVKAPGTPASDSEDAKPHSSSSASSGSATATAAGGSSSNAPAPNSAADQTAPLLMTAGLVVLSGLGAIF